MRKRWGDPMVGEPGRDGFSKKGMAVDTAGNEQYSR